MSNTYYVNGRTLLDGDIARAEDVNAEFDRVVSAFDKLPDVRSDGNGFTQAIKIPNGLNDDEATTKGQMDAAIAMQYGSNEANKIASQAAQAASEAARDAALNHANNAQSFSAEAMNQANVAITQVALAEDQVDIATAQALIATNQANVSIAKAAESSGHVDTAMQWASSDNEIGSSGLYSAKKYAADAKQYREAAGLSETIAVQQATLSTNNKLASESALDIATTKASEAAISAFNSAQAADVSTSVVAAIQSQADAILAAQAQANAFIGMGIGSSYVDVNGHLIMTYNDATITNIGINTSGHLTLTY